MFHYHKTLGIWQASIVSPTWQADLLARQLLKEIFPLLGGEELGGVMEVQLPFGATLEKPDEPGEWRQAPIITSLPPGSFDLESPSGLSTFVEQTLGWRRQAAVLVSPTRTSLFCEPLSLSGERANQAYALLALSWSGEPAPQQMLRDARLLKDYLRFFLRAAFAAVQRASLR